MILQRMKIMIRMNIVLLISAPLNVDAMNIDYISKSNEVWDEMEKERWLYNLDGEEGILPKFKKDTKKRDKKPKIDHVPTFEEEEKTNHVLTFEEEEALVLQEMEAG